MASRPAATPRRADADRGGSGAAVERGGGVGSGAVRQPPARHPPPPVHPPKSLHRKSLTTINDAFRLAVANVSSFGDTDVFPSPLDRFPCQDTPDAVVAVLEEVHRTFDQYLANEPPENIDTLAPLGYTSFRWATQIDPLWNLYYLSLVLSIAETIESKRLPPSE